MPPDVVCGQRRSGSQMPGWTLSSFCFASSQPCAENSRQDSHTYAVFFSLGSSPPLPQCLGEAPQLLELCELPAEVVVVLKLCSV